MDDKYIFIGKHALIKDAPNKSLIGLSGKLVDETKNTLVFESGKQVMKNGLVLSIEGKEFMVSSKRVEDRIKSR